MPEAKPFPAAQIAALLKVSERRLQQLADEGYIKKEGRGLYGLVDSVQGYIRFLKESSAANTRGTATARLAEQQAIKVEMENLRRAGELVYAAQAAETLNQIAAQLASQLDALPGRIASECAGRDAGFIRSRVLDECRSIRLSLSEHLAQRADALESLPDSSADLEAAEEEIPDEVGGG